MSSDIIIVNSVAALLIIFVVWWFFGSTPRAQVLGVDQPITILVKDGIYQPSYIQVPKEKPITLKFVRKDPTPCAESLIFPQLDIAYQLPMNQTVEIKLPPQAPGEIEFVCQMGMFRGRLVIV